MTFNICAGSFNILADGLSSGEFLCEGGDAVSTDWAVRGDKIVSILANMLRTCDVVVTQENDHFVQILSALRDVHSLNVGGVFGTNVNRNSTAQKLTVVKQMKDICDSTDASQPSPAVISVLYEECNSVFRKDASRLTSLRSFHQESSTFGAAFAAMYGNEADDLYRSNDGIGVYYHMDKLQLAGVHLPNRTVQSTSSPLMTLVSNMDYVLACTFQLRSASTTDTLTSSQVPVFTFYGAHLSSGEDVTKEHARCWQLYAIFNDAQQQTNPVIAMDSNSSMFYEMAYPDKLIPIDASDQSLTSPHSAIAPSADKTVNPAGCIPGKLSTLIEQFHFIDAVGPLYQTGNECFKMRHGQGGQPSKHFQFMFDTIDKILLPQCMQLVPHQYERSAFGFTRYDTALREELVHLRTSPSARREWEDFCRNSERVSGTTCSITAFGSEHILSGLYPNTQAPSDHPPVTCSFLLG